jgi:sugar-specific transcriptional regulator TrmB
VSQEKVLKTLVSLGLTPLDAKVYVLLAKKGPIKARDAAKALKISKQRLYPIIKNLQSKGIVNSTLERPARFSAVPFEKMLDSFLKAKMEQARRIQQNKDELLSDWQSIAIAESESSPAKFTVIEGRSYVYSKIQQMIKDTESHLSFVATVPSLARADQFGLFDAAFNHPLRSKIRFRFLTELSEQNANALKALLKKKPKADFNIEGKAPDLGLKLCPRMVIRDEEEAAFFIDPRKGEVASEQDDVCLWTNCKSLVHAFLAMFEDLWRNATDIEKKIVEVETGKPTPKTYIISDAETVRKKYDATIRSAKEEVLMLTSARGLIECRENIILFEEQARRRVTIKIMAPIMNENFEAANQLSKHFEVRHVPVSYLRTTIIDRKHLFQFKNPPSGQESYEAMPHYEDAFYSADPEYVDKTKAMMDDVWENAHALSPITLASVLGIDEPKAGADSEERRFSVYRKTIARIEDEKLGVKTEKDVLNEFIHAKKYPAESSQNRAYCCIGHAIIHPPKYFKLPDMMLNFYHFEKQSTLGAEDTLKVYLWLKTPAGYTFVPAAVIQDNPKVTDHYKVWFAGTPAGDNIHLIAKDDLQIRIRGNTLFAVWTIPIPLSPLSAIPPCCIMMEGYGSIKTGSYTMILPSGYKFKHQTNGLDAFVTFMHPASKYTGPGTDGYLCRDVIMDIYPP